MIQDPGVFYSYVLAFEDGLLFEVATARLAGAGSEHR